jgi:hypothetical protein
VIETIGFQGQVNSGEIGFLNIQLTAGAGTAMGPTFGNHVIPSVKLTSVFPSSDYIGGIGSSRMYADAGSTVTVVYNRGTFSSGSVNMGVCITGYFVNLP